MSVGILRSRANTSTLNPLGTTMSSPLPGLWCAVCVGQTGLALVCAQAATGTAAIPARASPTAMLDNFCLGAIKRFMTPPAALRGYGDWTNTTTDYRLFLCAAKGPLSPLSQS